MIILNKMNNRHNNNTANSYHNPFPQQQQQQQEEGQEEEYNSIILCGTTRSKCGYCQGSRTAILSVPNPPPFSTASNDDDDKEQEAEEAEESVTPSTSSKAYSILSSSISPFDYQTLVNKGWRRSGDLLYLPKNWECCCPSHPIRLDVNRFRPSKSHRKVLRCLDIALSGGKSTTSECMIQTDMSYEYLTHDDSQNASVPNTTATSSTANNNNYNNICVRTNRSTSTSASQSTQQSLLLLQGRKRPRKSNHTGTTTTTTTGTSDLSNTHQKQHPQSLSSSSPSPSPPTLEQIHEHTKKILSSSFSSSSNNNNNNKINNNNNTYNHKSCCHHLLLSWLQTRTMQIVHNYLTSNNLSSILSTSNNNNNNHNHIFNHDKIYEIIKKCSNYKIKKMTKPKHLQVISSPSQSLSSSSMNYTTTTNTTAWSYEIQITLSSTICPALHGITNGYINKNQIGNVIVQELLLQHNNELNGCCASCSSTYNNYSHQKQDLNSSCCCSSSSGGGGGGGCCCCSFGDSCGYDIESISFHSESGHVNVSMKMNTTLMVVSSPTTVSNSLSSNDNLDNNQHSCDAKTIKNKKYNTTTTSTTNMMVDDNNNNHNKKRAKMEDVLSEFVQCTIDEESSMGYQHIHHHHQKKQSISPPFKLTVKSIPSHISGRDPKVHRLYAKYQAAIHNDPDPYLLHHRKKQEYNKMKKTSDGIDENNYDHSHDEYRDNNSSSNTMNFDIIDDNQNILECEKLNMNDFERIYQRLYDKEQLKLIYKSYSDYYRFLCSSPLPRQNREIIQSSSITSLNNNHYAKKSEEQQHINSSPLIDINDEDAKIPYGSYHQQYLINDKYLVAVGVIDILPHCISSVYAFYDPVVSNNINLGKLTALYEIEWVKHAQVFRPNLSYYYLGYYIHSCQKMRYKSEYKPSELLCPVRRVWIDFDIAKKRIEVRSPIRHCCDLSTPTNNKDDYDEKEELYNNCASNISLSNREYHVNDFNLIKLQLSPNQSFVTANMLTDEGRDIVRPILNEFIHETGIDVARKCVIKLY